MRVLITGVTGLVGSHLAAYLLDEHPDVEVTGLKRWRADDRTIAHLRPGLKLIEGDLIDPASVRAAVQQANPDRVFHLGGQSYPSESWAAPVATLETNVIGAVHVLEAVRELGRPVQVQLAGSAAAYGFIRPDEVPISEDQPLRPLSPYGVSKAALEMTGYQYAKSYDMPIFLTRSGIHIGPGQDARTSAQTFAYQIAEAELGLRDPVIDVGNLDAERDYLDAADAVRALWALLDRGRPAEPYNVSSGRPVRVGDMLDAYRRLAKVDVEVRVDPARLRPVDEPILVSDNSKLRRDTGWEPAVPLEETLQRILDHWRGRLRVQAGAADPV